MSLDLGIAKPAPLDAAALVVIGALAFTRKIVSGLEAEYEKFPHI